MQAISALRPILRERHQGPDRPSSDGRQRGQGTDIIGLEVATTIGEVFRERVRRSPDAAAYMHFEPATERWVTTTWSEVARAVGRWQAALRAEGLVPGDRVSTMLRNCLEWTLFDLAAQGLGLVTVPVYPNDRPENLAYILRDSGSQLLLLEDQACLDKMMPAAEQLARLERIVTVQPIEQTNAAFSTLVHLADWLPDVAGSFQVVPHGADDLATIVYTSGTTGRAKGVMLSHRNMLWNIQAGLQMIAVHPSDLFLSFLPLSHTLERTIGYYLPIVAGSTVAYARSIAELAEDLVEVAPTILISVPRVFERVRSKLLAKLESDSAAARGLFEKAVELGWRQFQRQQGRAEPWSPGLTLSPVLDRLVGAKVRARLGGRLRFAVCGGAPLSPEVARLFIGLGVPLIQGYGLTETSPVISVNRLEDNIPTSVGSPLPGVELRIGHEQELLTRSPSVMLGYWQAKKATRCVLDPDGWLHTGDCARIEGDHIYITGRLKEIIVLANGEKVSPGEVEMAIAADPLFDQVLVIGEGRPYLAALAALNPDAFEGLAAELHLDPEDPASLQDPTLLEILKARATHQLDAFPGYVQLHRIAATRGPWTTDNGLVTPTLKLRRQQILQRFGAEVASLYAGHA